MHLNSICYEGQRSPLYAFFHLHSFLNQPANKSIELCVYTKYFPLDLKREQIPIESGFNSHTELIKKQTTKTISSAVALKSHFLSLFAQFWTETSIWLK